MSFVYPNYSDTLRWRIGLPYGFDDFLAADQLFLFPGTAKKKPVGTPAKSGSGSLFAARMLCFGLAEMILGGTGSLVAAAMTASGTGSVIIGATGVLTAGDMEALGTGFVHNQPNLGDGDLVADDMEAAGVGKVKIIGVGVLEADDMEAAGVGKVINSGSGTLTASAMTCAGIGGTPPQTTSFLNYFPDNNAVILAWAAAGGAAGYYIFRYPNSVGQAFYGQMNGAIHTPTTYTDNTALNGHSYQYYIVTADSLGVRSLGPPTAAVVTVVPVAQNDIFVDTMQPAANTNITSESPLIPAGTFPWKQTAGGAAVTCCPASPGPGAVASGNSGFCYFSALRPGRHRASTASPASPLS